MLHFEASAKHIKILGASEQLADATREKKETLEIIWLSD